MSVSWSYDSDLDVYAQRFFLRLIIATHRYSAITLICCLHSYSANYLKFIKITLLGKYKTRLEDKGHVEVTNIKSTLKSKRFIHWTIPCLKTSFAESSRNATTNMGHSHSLNLNIRHNGVRASVCPCHRIPPPLNQDTVSLFYFFKNCLSQLFQCLTTIYSSINRSACCHKLDKQHAPSLSKHRINFLEEKIYFFLLSATRMSPLPCLDFIFWYEIQVSSPVTMCSNNSSLSIWK